MKKRRKILPLIISFMLLALPIISSSVRSQDTSSGKSAQKAYTGKFASRHIKIEIHEKDGNYFGTLTFQGNQYLFKGTVQGDLFKGNFLDVQEPYHFTLKTVGKNLLFKAKQFISILLRQKETSKGKSDQTNIPSGFTYLKTSTYSCGGKTHTVREYKHDQTGMEFVLIPGGLFQMGGDKKKNTLPKHHVLIKPFLISKCEVTQGVWKAVMKNKPWTGCGKDQVKYGEAYPAVYISWNMAKKFCKETGFRLPSEAEWEYACRAGTTTKYYWGNKIDGDYAWYYDNVWKVYKHYAQKVGEKKPNAFGLHDMIGNVWEWCEDSRHTSYYGAPTDGRPWLRKDDLARVHRGGAFNSGADYFSSAYRSYNFPRVIKPLIGFRVAVDCWDSPRPPSTVPRRSSGK